MHGSLVATKDFRFIWKTVRWLAVLATLGRAPASAPAQDVRHSTGKFQAGGKAIPVESFVLPGTGRRPAVVILHACDGLKTNGWIYRHEAKGLAKLGYVVLLVHYLERTGDGEGVDPKTISAKNYVDWADTIRLAIDYAVKHPHVDPDRIGLLGLSLGGYLALGISTDQPLRIRAVADWFGGLRPELQGGLRRLPPVLIIHDEDDDMVPVKEAHALDKLLKARNLSSEKLISRKQGHLFMKNPFGKEAQAAKKCTLDFFARYLQGNLAEVKHRPATRVHSQATTSTLP